MCCLGIGDDAAVLDVRCRSQARRRDGHDRRRRSLSQRHAAADIGYRALAVNLSDLAAMGAEPAWFTLSLSMPQQRRALAAAVCGGPVRARARTRCGARRRRHRQRSARHDRSDRRLGRSRSLAHTRAVHVPATPSWFPARRRSSWRACDACNELCQRQLRPSVCGSDFCAPRRVVALGRALAAVRNGGDGRVRRLADRFGQAVCGESAAVPRSTSTRCRISHDLLRDLRSSSLRRLRAGRRR